MWETSRGRTRLKLLLPISPQVWAALATARVTFKFGAVRAARRRTWVRDQRSVFGWLQAVTSPGAVLRGLGPPDSLEGTLTFWTVLRGRQNEGGRDVPRGPGHPGSCEPRSGEQGEWAGLEGSPRGSSQRSLISSPRRSSVRVTDPGS